MIGSIDPSAGTHRVSASVSPGSILSTARLRLEDIDQQIRTGLTELEEKSAQAQRLNTQIAALNSIQSAINQKDGRKEINGNHLVTWAGQEQPAYKVLEEVELADLLGSYVPDEGKFGKLNLQALEKRVQALQQHLSRTNAGNELQMVDMQNQMQRRSEILQLATMMLRSVHESQLAIIRNLS